MSRTRETHDPDFGTLEIPPPPKREDGERLLREQQAAFAKRRRLWPDGALAECPSCERRTFVGRNDLSHEVARPGGVIIYRHLQGARCSHCGAQSLEPWELMQIEAEAGIGQVADYEAKVSNIGSGTVGTYWPKDVVRVMDLSPETRAYIQIIDRETALIRFVKGRGAMKASGKKAAAAGKRARGPGGGAVRGGGPS